MNMGLDYSKILLILVLVLIFFGSKEIPNFIRQAARFMAKIRVYSEKVRHEINEIGKLDEPMPSYDQQAVDKKNSLRETYIAKRKALTDAQRAEKSAAIWRHLAKEPAFADAKAVMMYVEMGAEVATRQAIREIIASGRRVVVPYVQEDSCLGIGEITDPDSDVSAAGQKHIPEPVREKRDNFFKSDIRLIVCPAVAFDIYGARLGRGKGCYDRFLKEMKGKMPVYGVAFDCQILPADDRLPFAYHDVVMDQVITESGLLMKTQDAEPPAPAEPSAHIDKPSQPAG
jgi:5-formyltetrahydrofolate cyclo-ligase